GCRRDTAFENIDRAIRQSLLKLQIDISDIDMIASIDVKKDEPGIKEFCERNRIEFVTYTADELMAVQGEFSASQFVREHVGVDNVCERAAVLACSRECNKAGELIYKKHKYDRVTVAAARYPD
ncbi:MAG: cobalamin biosynthesis protein, partial [Agathobacter rectalis]